MEKIGLLVRNLIIIVVMAAFLELLIPVGEMRRYVRMVIGILVILAVLQVLVGLFDRTGIPPVPRVTVDKPPGFTNTGQSEFQAEYAKRVVDAYRGGLARQVKALAHLAGLDVAEVEVVVDDSGGKYPRLTEIRLHLDPSAAAGDSAGAEKAIGAIADFYNLPHERVLVAVP
ncbi:MAG: stage III sporulation protein AF [Bacillota bacterium]